MTLLVNGFESGTNTTAISHANSGDSADNAFDSVTIGSGGTAAYSSTEAKRGSLSCYTATTTANATQLVWSTSMGTQSTIYFRCYLYFASIPTATTRFFTLSAGGTGYARFAIVATTGKVLVSDANGTTITTSTNAIATGQWVRIEGYAIGSATVGQTSMSLYNTADSGTATETNTSNTSQDTGGSFTTYIFGPDAATASQGPYYMDDAGISSVAALGPSTITSTGSPALAPKAMSGTGAEKFSATGSAALAPRAMSATGRGDGAHFTGSMALAPKALHVTACPDTIVATTGNYDDSYDDTYSDDYSEYSGGFALAPLAMHATDAEGFTATASMALAPRAMSAPQAPNSIALAPLAMQANGFLIAPFPVTPLTLLFELLVGSTWTDISDWVYQRQDITITRGRPDEGSNAIGTPAQATFTLNNRDGRFSPRNPPGPYYGQFGRNTQLRISASADPGGDILSYRFWGETSEWPPTWDQTGNDIAVAITASGILRRLNQNAALNSTLRRYYQQLTSQPLAYWPAEDGSTAQSLASGVAGGFPMTWTGSPALASDSGLPASLAFPGISQAVFEGITGVSGALPVATTAVFTPGSGHWTCPPGVSEILVQAWGAGGGGSGSNGSTGGAAGGGGGEYSSRSLPVTPGTSYAWTVGSSSSAGNGGTTTMNGDDSEQLNAHGGRAGSADGETGGAGGTGSTATVHFGGGAGAAGSGGPGNPGTTTNHSAVFTSPGTNTWNADSTITGSVTAYVWGGGGGGAGGRGDFGGGGGAGGNFNSATLAVTGGNTYDAIVAAGGPGEAGEGTAGGDTAFLGDSERVDAHGGLGGNHTDGTGGAPSGAESIQGGHGGAGSSSGGLPGGGGGGGASAGGNGGNSHGYASGAGGPASGGLPAGGTGGTNDRAGTAPGGGGGGGDGGATPRDGQDGAGGRIELYWTDETAPGAAAIGGGGGSSGGNASAGNPGSTEAGGAAVTGGGPGGGTLSGGTFNEYPVSGPGGGGAGFDSKGAGGAAGYGGLLQISWAPSGAGNMSAYNGLRYVLHVPAGGDTDGAVVSRLFTTGTIAYADVIYNTTDPVTLGLTTVPATNPNPEPVLVTVAGGTVTEVAVNGSDTGETSGTFTVPASGTITVTYSSAPTTFTTAATPGTGGYLTLKGFTGAGAQLFTTGKVAFNCEGKYVLVSAELTGSGSNVDCVLTGIIAGQYTTIATGSSTLDDATLGQPYNLTFDPGASLTGTTWAHAAIQTAYDPVTDLAGPLAAYAGETAATRFARICTEENIPYVFTDAAGYTDTTAQVGPQLPVKMAQLLQDVEDADRGLLYEPRDSFGVAYTSRWSLYQQSPAVTLDYGLGQLGYPLQPTDDDQLIRNDVTTSRPNGSSYEYQVTTGPLSIQDPPDGVGSYTYSQSPNVYADYQLADISSWTAFVGTVNELRYPGIYVDLSRAEVVLAFEGMVSADVGNFVQITDTSASPLPPGDVNQLAYGFTEVLNAFKYQITVNAVPESPYEIAEAYDTATSTGALANTDGAYLESAIGTADTSFSVVSPAPNQPWIDSGTYPDWFPFSIVIDGEEMSVQSVTGTSSPQVFTVERAINGVSVTHNALAAVNLSQIAYTAL